MEPQREAERAIGRYRSSWLYLIMPVLVCVVEILAHLVHIARVGASAEDYVVIGVFLVLLVAVWLMPATILATAGFRRAVRFQLVAWDEVVAIFPGRTG